MTMQSSIVGQMASHAKVGELATGPVTPKGRRTREALLNAGEIVAERYGLSGLSVAAVAEQAGVAKGTFYLYFSDRESFIDALHQRFYSQVTAAVNQAVTDLPRDSSFCSRRSKRISMSAWQITLSRPSYSRRERRARSRPR